MRRSRTNCFPNRFVIFIVYLFHQLGSCQLHGVASLQDHLDVILPAVLLSEDELKVEQDKLAEQNSQESHKPQPTPEEA